MPEWAGNASIFRPCKKTREARQRRGSQHTCHLTGWNQTVDKSNPHLLYFGPAEQCVKKVVNTS